VSEQTPDLPAGRVGRAHGLDGSFYVTGARARLLSLGASVSVAGRTLEIVRRSGTDQRPIVRLAGIEQRAAAEALRGQVLTVAQRGAPALADGEWWAHELEGCAVLDAAGRAIGSVGRLLELPSCEVLEVQRPQGGEPLLVPLVKDAILGVDTAAGEIAVDAEFLGLDEPSEQAEGAAPVAHSPAASPAPASERAPADPAGREEHRGD
jgi:16S rRNA processing protein RimM